MQNFKRIETDDEDDIEPTTIKKEQDSQLSLQPEVYGSGFNLPRIRIKTDLTINPEKMNTQLSENNETTTDS